MVLYLGILLTASVILISLFSPSYKYPLIALILVRPVIGATWNYRYADMSLIYVLNMTFVLILMMRFLLKKEKIFVFPYLKLFIIYVSILVFVSIHIYMNSGIISALDFFFKSLFMPLAFYLFYTYFVDYKSGKLLAVALIVSGLFPLIFVFIQKITGQAWLLRESRGLIRNVGLYHDSVTVRIFLLQTLIGLLIYWHYFLERDNKVKRVILIILFSFSILGLYFLYSKAVIITLILWSLMYVFLRRKLHLLPLVLVLVLFINHFTENQVYNEIHQVFSREVNFARGELETDYVLAGRGMLWRVYLNEWSELPIIRKVIGDGVSHLDFHNDYLRILFSGGVLLLSYYVLFTLVLYLSVINAYRKYRKFIHFAALLCIVCFLIESIGQVAGIYPDTQTVIWGLVGLSINKDLKWNNHIFLKG